MTVTLLFSQTIGGSSVYNFLKLPLSAQASALGGTNISHQSRDLTMSVQNAALLTDSMDGEVSTTFNAMYGGIKNLGAITAFTHKKWKTNFAAGITFLDYGKTTTTDASGNVNGSFRPIDFVVQLQASRKYESVWNYGIALKYIHSSYGIYNSTGLAADFGITYLTKNKMFQAGFTSKNMGVQIKSYTDKYEDLPFDVQIGVSQKFRKIPLQVSVTAHHLHQFNIRYDDPAFETSEKSKGKTLDKILRHFIIGAQVLLDKLEISAGYNFLRAKELHITEVSNGATGLSFGVGAIVNKLQVRYAMAFYQNTKAYHQIGIQFSIAGFSF